MEEGEVLDVVESFVAGFGKRDDADINNAVFIAVELQGLDVPLDFKGAGRHGVESPRLYRILRDAKPNQKNQDVFCIGETYSEFSSEELMLMASYLWNEGQSSLNEEEIKEAAILLQREFGAIVKRKKATESFSAAASG
jgi:hypothetical protein